MSSYYSQNDVLKMIKEYDICEELLEDLLELPVYDDKGKATFPDCKDCPNRGEMATTNINFICSKDKIEDMLEKIAKNNNGRIAVLNDK